MDGIEKKVEREVKHVCCDLETIKEINAKAVEQAPDAMVFADPEGRIVEVNQAAELMFGYHRNELLSQSVEMLIPEELRKRHSGHRSTYTEEPRSRDMGVGLKLAARHRTGRVFPVEIKLSPIMITGAGMFIMTVIRRVRTAPAPFAAGEEER